MHRSDRGVQYISLSFSKRLGDEDLLLSMRRIGLELPPIGSSAECKVGTDARSSGKFSRLPDVKEQARGRTPTVGEGKRLTLG
jgi:hypothetical protein